MQRMPYVRHGAIACPFCGAVRIIPGMIYCDQCGKRIPDSLMQKVQDENNTVPKEPKRPEKPGQMIVATGPLVSSDDVGRSAATMISGDRLPENQPSNHGGRERAWNREQTLGVCFATFGVLTAVASMFTGIGNLVGVGLASFLIGVLLFHLRSRPSFAPELVEALTLSSLGNIERVLRELGPDTKALYTKTRERLDVPMVFLPAEDNPARAAELIVSDRDRLLFVDRDDLHRTGLLFEPPGGSLLALMEKEAGVNFFDLDSACYLDPLKSSMTESLEVAVVKTAATKEGLKLRIEDGALGELSESMSRSAPHMVSRLGCPICSAAICAVVKVFKTDMTLEEATHHARSHTVSLRFVGGEVI